MSASAHIVEFPVICRTKFKEFRTTWRAKCKHCDGSGFHTRFVPRGVPSLCSSCHGVGHWTPKSPVPPYLRSHFYERHRVTKA